MSSRPTKAKKRLNFAKKLQLRELFGEPRRSSIHPKENFFHYIPQRQVFPLALIAPKSALTAGHIFLGFTKCGQFLLSYTNSFDTSFNHSGGLSCRYRLHWWLFVPNLPLKKVAEVALFGDQDLQGIHFGNFFLSICQWPNDCTKVLVYGFDRVDEPWDNGMAQSRRCHLTITAVPSLDNCSDCHLVAKSYGEEDVAENWNSCLRFSCLEHGITVHTSFEVVPPFPRFVPSIQMKRKSFVVINTGNFIHVLNVNLENICKRTVDSICENENILRHIEMDCQSTDQSDDDLEAVQASINRINTCDNSSSDTEHEISINTRTVTTVSQCDKDREWQILISSSFPCNNHNSSSNIVKKSPGHVLYDGRSSDSDECSEFVSETESNNESLNRSRNKMAVPIKIDKETVKFDNILHPKACSSKCTVRLKPPDKKADNEYDFIDESSDSGYEKLSVFRRRRLADKKYEFSDENSENIPKNYRSFRNQIRNVILSPRPSRLRSIPVSLSELSVDLGDNSGFFRSVYEKLLSPSGSCSPNDVLRPINQNITSPTILSPRDDRLREEIDKIEKAEIQRWNSRDSLSMLALSPSQVSRTVERTVENNQVVNCVVEIKRRFVEIDDEMVSIITDIEDDELSSATGYHNALPLEVHGSGYSQMHMISNPKAEKLMLPGVLVRQVSLDVEQFCHETAEKICNESGKKFFCCSDYNVEIIDVCSKSGDIIAIASVLVQASTTKVTSGKTLRSKTSLCRRQYRTSSTFIFNMNTKQYYLIEKEHHLEDDAISLSNEACNGALGDEKWWQNARNIAMDLRNQFMVPSDYHSSVKSMTNESVLQGKSLSHIIEGQHLVGLVLGPLEE